MLPRTRAQLLFGHLTVQLLVLGALWFTSANGWLHALGQVIAGAASAAVVLLGVRLQRPEGALAWYFIAAGMLVSASGTLVEMIAWRGFGVTTNPNAADGFWLALFPGLIGGIGVIAYRRAALEDMGTMMLNTLVCVILNLFVGILGWEMIVWHTLSDPNLTLANRLVVTAYPLADLMVLALLLRPLLGGGWRSPNLLLMIGAVACFLAADMGWSGFLRSGLLPDDLRQFLMEATSLTARALLGAAALHPGIRTLAPSAGGRVPPLGGFGWAGLLACALTAPLVIALQAILDRLYSVTSL